MYKYFKFLTMLVLILSLSPNINSMDKNTINQNTINTNNNINHNNININHNNISQQHDKDGFCICNPYLKKEFFTYNPYSIDSPIPTQEDLLQFMKVTELDVNNENVQRCFKYLQEYDPHNCLLLDNLLEGIYSISYDMSTNYEAITQDFTGDKSISCPYHILESSIYNVRCYLRHYGYERRHYRIYRTNHYRYSNLKLEKIETSVCNAECSEILTSLNMLGCTLNPEKYKNKYILNESIDNINLVKLCYYIANTLVCISHDIVYAFNKEIDKLSNNYNDKNKRDEISNNIYHIIIRSFNGIMNALVEFEGVIFFHKLLNVKQDYYSNFESHFKCVSKSVCKVKYMFNRLLNTESNKSTLNKISALMKEIRKYKNSGELNNKLLAEVKKDKNFDLYEQYNHMEEYLKKI